MNLLRWLYAVTIFSSAFLLFVVEPMAAKQLLPIMGGSSAVWTTCLVFFSVMLLLGYLYAHWLSARLRRRAQAIVHVAVLTAALLILGVHVRPNPIAATYHPALTVFRILATLVGLPFLALSATNSVADSLVCRELSRTVSVPVVCAFKPGIAASAGQLSCC